MRTSQYRRRRKPRKVKIRRTVNLSLDVKQSLDKRVKTIIGESEYTRQKVKRIAPHYER